MSLSDLDVLPISETLADYQVDFIVTGSIAAVEAVRHIRALRRLGARVKVWLSSGGSRFVGLDALSWASGQPCQSDFNGAQSHVAQGDALIVAPCSASFLAKWSQGLAHEAPLALALSYLGTSKPICVLRTMHESMAQAPTTQANIKAFGKRLRWIQPRTEEAKEKSPEPAHFADLCAHEIHRALGVDKKIFLSLGPTRARIDAVRFITNHSTGALGTLIAAELYRQGYQTLVVAGPGGLRPELYSQLAIPEDFPQFVECVSEWSKESDAIVMAAAVLDFIPESPTERKLDSSSPPELRLINTPKLLPQITAKTPLKVGFKLTDTVAPGMAAEPFARHFIAKNRLSALVINQISDVKPIDHQADFFANYPEWHYQKLNSKIALAAAICEHLTRGLQCLARS